MEHPIRGAIAVALFWIVISAVVYASGGEWTAFVPALPVDGRTTVQFIFKLAGIGLLSLMFFVLASLPAYED